MMNKVAIERLVKEMSENDIELLLSILEVELKDRYYVKNPPVYSYNESVYKPESLLEII